MIKHILLRDKNDTKTTCDFTIDFYKKNNLRLIINEGMMNLRQFIKYIIKYTDIPNIKYKRVSPYTIQRKLIRADENESVNYFTQFIIKFMDIRDNQEKESVIFETVGGSWRLEQKIYDIFIPDLMELIVYLDYAKKDGSGYIITKNTSTSSYSRYKEINNNQESMRNVVNVKYDVGGVVKEYEQLISTLTNVSKAKPITKIKLSKQEKLSVLLAMINYSLDAGNKEEFMELTKEYNELIST